MLAIRELEIAVGEFPRSRPCDNSLESECLAARSEANSRFEQTEIKIAYTIRYNPETKKVEYEFQNP